MKWEVEPDDDAPAPNNIGRHWQVAANSTEKPSGSCPWESFGFGEYRARQGPRLYSRSTTGLAVGASIGPGRTWKAVWAERSVAKAEIKGAGAYWRE